MFFKQGRECAVQGILCPVSLFDLCSLLIGGPSYCCQYLCSLFESVQVKHILEQVCLVFGSVWLVSDCLHVPLGSGFMQPGVELVFVHILYVFFLFLFGV